MPRRSRTARRLVVGEATYLWRVGHAHRYVADGATALERFLDCREILTIRRLGGEAQLRVVFGQGEGRLVPDGWLHSGAVGTGDAWLNLHEPGVVRALLDEAAGRGRAFEGHGVADVDGWPLFDAVVAGRRG
ncbi:hypothetical protein ABH931_002961 [Streptacidiphilus sp. MAP12-33]|uniref:hypothetical protein n=1 Tax=Streptacidiphilus sp. MAP12-33 TaxID=3156266 RepID=UPI0035174EA7